MFRQLCLCSQFKVRNQLLLKLLLQHQTVAVWNVFVSCCPFVSSLVITQFFQTVRTLFKNVLTVSSVIEIFVPSDIFVYNHVWTVGSQNWIKKSPVLTNSHRTSYCYKSSLILIMSLRIFQMVSLRVVPNFRRRCSLHRHLSLRFSFIIQ